MMYIAVLILISNIFDHRWSTTKRMYNLTQDIAKIYLIK